MLSQLGNTTAICIQPQHGLHYCDANDNLPNLRITEEDIYSNIHLYSNLAAQLVATKVSESVLNGLVRDGLITEQQREEISKKSTNNSSPKF